MTRTRKLKQLIPTEIKKLFDFSDKAFKAIEEIISLVSEMKDEIIHKTHSI